MRWLGQRLALLTTAVALSLTAFMGFVTGSAGADPPRQQGWWTVTNPGPAPEGLPVHGTPAPPDVPAGGLLVQGGPSTPGAYAALVYQVASGATVGRLNLKVASGSATTSGSKLQVCPLTNPTIDAEQGGPIADAPPYDCSKKAIAQPSSSGDSYQFDVSAFVADGALAVAILPTGSTDRVVFNAPGGDSLTVQPGTTSSLGVTQDTTAAGGSVTPPVAGTPGATTAGLGPSIAPAALAPSLSPSAPAIAIASPQNSASAALQTPAALQPTTSSISHGGGTNPAAVGALLAGLLLGGGLWLIAGHTAARSVAE